jgi:predicted permease
VAAFYDDDARVVGAGEAARRLDVSLVSGSFWGMFDARPALGRFFGEPEDRTPSGTAVAVLGFGFWQSSFGGAADVLGRQLLVGPRSYTIIGVAPKGFNGMSLRQVAVFIPLTAGGYDDFGDHYFSGHNLSWLQLIGRRRAGVEAAPANADLTLAFQRSRSGEPGLRPEAVARSSAELAPLAQARDPRGSDDARVTLWLTGTAAVVLLIASANVANLLLARGLRRRREMAVRVALGAGRRRLLRQLLVESALLTLLGGAAGLLIGHAGGGVLRRLLLADLDWSSIPLLDLRTLAFTAGVALITTLLTGLFPAWQAGSTDLVGALKAGGREGSRRRTRLRSALLVAQSALSVMLLIGAGLFVRSLHNVNAVDLGYDPGRLILVDVNLRGEQLAPEARTELNRRLLERALAVPGVERATVTFGLPFWRSNNTDLFVPGRDSLGGLGAFYENIVGADYFDVTGTTIQRGRAITAADREARARVAVVSETLGRRVWAGADPIGQCVKIGADTMPCTEVVGIARDVRWGSLGDDDRMQIYEPMDPRDAGSLYLRVRAHPEQIVEPLRRELQRLVPGAAYVSARVVATTLDPVLRPWRLGATMFSLFGGLALLVAAVGLYGMIAYSVAQRSHEMGVRAALGAARSDLIRLVMAEGLRITAVGILVGTALAFGVGPFIGSLLFGVGPRDLSTTGTVAAVLLLVAGIATLLPAWRAARADPSAALRTD